MLHFQSHNPSPSLELFIIIERGHGDFGFLSVGPMNRPAIVPQRFLGEAFRIATDPRPLRPRVTVAVKADTLNSEEMTPSIELFSPVLLVHHSEFWEQWAG